ncbi:hypothetical protein [Hyphomicrobium sp. 99]|uniref:hypothetical protein n=1 Tax=Hyphomicrobium sp. 99 TaxID=1163419 RepID=UPI0005F83028|nr:hypothetical protein [Hyphomicrobium sp. 99]
MTTDGDAHVVIEAQDATVQDVLLKLSEGRGFKVERADEARDDARISGRFEGPLAHVLERVLEKENNFVERSPDQPRTIARVVLYGAFPASAPASDAQTAPAAQPVAPQPAPVEIKVAPTVAIAPTQNIAKPTAPRRSHLTRRKQIIRSVASSTTPVVK